MRRLFSALEFLQTRPFIEPALLEYLHQYEKREILTIIVQDYVVRNWGDTLVLDADNDFWSEVIFKDETFRRLFSRMFDCRLSFVAKDLSDLIRQLRLADAANTPILAKSPFTVLCFSGQDGHLAQISQTLYNSSKILQKHLDACELACTQGLGVQNVLFPSIFEDDPIEDLATLHCDADDVAILLKSAAKKQGKTFAADTACFNGPRNFVLAGDEASMHTVECIGEKTNQFRMKRLSNSHAYHSRLLDGLLPSLRAAAAKLDFKAPSIPIQACTDDECQDDWMRFMQTVRRIERAASGRPILWLEVGSGGLVIPMIKNATLDEVKKHQYVSTSLRDDSMAQHNLATATRKLWESNVEVQSPILAQWNKEGSLVNTCSMLRDVLEIPMESIRPNCTLEDLGIDSLLAIELFSEVTKRFSVSLSHAQFADAVSLYYNKLNSIIITTCSLDQIEVTYSNGRIGDLIAAMSKDQATSQPITAAKQSSLDSDKGCTVVCAERNGLKLEADIYYSPARAAASYEPLPIALMIHGGGHVMHSRKDIRPEQTQMLLDAGFLPVSIDYRLCPELSLVQGALIDVRDALCWARETLPTLTFPGRPDLNIDGDRVVDGLFEQPIVAYSPPASTRLLGGWMSLQDPRSRIVLYMNWNGAALPILINGLSKEIARDERTKIPMPNREQIRSISPLAHIQDGTYRTPTYLIHGTADDLVPWQQSKRMMDALQEKGVPVHLQLLESEPHLFDMFRRSRRNGPAAAAIIGSINFLRESTGR
ncbi:Alpha/Beta hydrolase protein [Lophiotrema nucula]|uniref:Alpha/Beta hydrolase protein n=1 Tax=Lophiotrema nucula TaxID=690887 RepID=A0A6A5ZDE3_9PLEO|nr:Alpha/Beta hydrolase protein [Lophiotrema nucula]